MQLSKLEYQAEKTSSFGLYVCQSTQGGSSQISILEGERCVREGEKKRIKCMEKRKFSHNQSDLTFLTEFCLNFDEKKGRQLTLMDVLFLQSLNAKIVERDKKHFLKISTCVYIIFVIIAAIPKSSLFSLRPKEKKNPKPCQ